MRRIQLAIATHERSQAGARLTKVGGEGAAHVAGGRDQAAERERRLEDGGAQRERQPPGEPIEQKDERQAGARTGPGHNDHDQHSVGHLGPGPAARTARLKRADEPAHPDDRMQRGGWFPEDHVESSREKHHRQGERPSMRDEDHRLEPRAAPPRGGTGGRWLVPFTKRTLTQPLDHSSSETPPCVVESVHQFSGSTPRK